MTRVWNLLAAGIAAFGAGALWVYAPEASSPAIGWGMLWLAVLGALLAALLAFLGLFGEDRR